MKRTLWVTACLVGLLPVSQAWSQQRGQQQADPQQAAQQDQSQQQTGRSQADRRQQTEQQAETQRTRRRGAGQDAAGGNLVRPMATLLALGNQAEVELGQLASEKAQNPEVRQFAQMMVEEHTELLGKLKQFNPQIPDADRSQLRSAQATGRDGQPGTAQTPQRDRGVARTGGTSRTESTSRTGEANTQRQEEVAQTGFTTQGRAASGGQGALVSVIQDAAQQKLQMTKETLNKYEGQDFDMGYLSQQVHAHVGMLAHLKAMKGKGPSEFQQLVDDGITATDEHLQDAKNLAKKLEDKEYDAQGNQQN